jgi:hypothetical protein
MGAQMGAGAGAHGLKSSENLVRLEIVVNCRGVPNKTMGACVHSTCYKRSRKNPMGATLCADRIICPVCTVRADLLKTRVRKKAGVRRERSQKEDLLKERVQKKVGVRRERRSQKEPQKAGPIRRLTWFTRSHLNRACHTSHKEAGSPMSRRSHEEVPQ